MKPYLFIRLIIIFAEVDFVSALEALYLLKNINEI